MVSDHNVANCFITIACFTMHIGSVSLSPLSYRTLRSHVFNEVQPNNEGCVPVDGGVNTDCGQGTTLIDCNRGYNDNADYSDLSNYFIWNTSLGQQVFTEFRFGQEVRGRRISMFFWNSSSNSIIVPNVRIDWSDNNVIFRHISTITTNSPNRTEDGQHKLDIDINNAGLQFQYLRILMSFYSNSEWIFLSEVQFCGELSTVQGHIGSRFTLGGPLILLKIVLHDKKNSKMTV